MDSRKQTPPPSNLRVGPCSSVAPPIDEYIAATNHNVRTDPGFQSGLTTGRGAVEVGGSYISLCSFQLHAVSPACTTPRENPLFSSLMVAYGLAPFSLRDFDKSQCMQAESLTYFLMSEQYKCIQRAVFAMQAIPPSPPPLMHTDRLSHAYALQDGLLSREFICFLYASLMYQCVYPTFVCLHALILHSLLQRCRSAVYLGPSTVQLSEQRSLSLLTHLACLKRVLDVRVHASKSTKWSQMLCRLQLSCDIDIWKQDADSVYVENGVHWSTKQVVPADRLLCLSPYIFYQDVNNLVR